MIVSKKYEKKDMSAAHAGIPIFIKKNKK